LLMRSRLKFNEPQRVVRPRGFPSEELQAASGDGAEVLKAKSGAKLVHIPFPGAAPQLQAVLSGQVEIGVRRLGGPYTHMKNGTMRALLIMDDKRWSEFPDVPTAAELGIDIPRTVWNNNQALYAPAGTEHRQPHHGRRSGRTEPSA
jgi:tripartite-type tricarboxylate transporter receptor subunit TctC